MKHGKGEKFQMVGNQIHHSELSKEYIIWKNGDSVNIPTNKTIHSRKLNSYFPKLF